MLTYSIRNIIIGYGIAIGIVLLILLFTFFNLRAQEKELGKIKKAREVMQALEPGLLDIQESESSLNDLLFFGKDKYSDLHKDDLKKLQNDSMHLAEFADSYPGNREEYRQLADLIHQMTGFSAFAIYAHEMKSTGTGNNKWPKNSGDSIVKAFKAIVGKLEEKNRKILSESYGLTINLTRKTLTFVGIISGVLFLALLISFWVSYRDITNRLNYHRDLAKQVREKTAEFKESEEKYRSIIEQAPDGIFISGQDTFIIEANDSGCNMLGYSKKELQKLKFTELVSPEDLRNNPVKFDELRNKKIVSNERKLVRKDGSEISVEITAKLLADGRYQSFIHDITERKKTEERLRAIEFNNRMVVENKILAVAWASPDGKLFNANHTFCEMMGYGLEELKGIHFGKFTHPDDVVKELELIKKIENGEIDSYQIEKRYQNRQGNYFWVELNLTCYRNPETGRAEYFIGIIQDIQQKKIAQEALKTSEKNLRYVLSSTADIFYVIDRNYHITLINEIAEKNLARAWGKTVTLGANILDLIPKESDEPIKNSFEKVFTGERIEYEIYHPPGLDLPSWVVVNYMPVSDESGAIIGAYIVTKDITERKEAEKAVKESEERYRSLIEQASDYIMITDLKGNFIDVNSSLCKMFGYRREELLGMNISAVIDPEQLKNDPIRFDLLLSGQPMLRERRMMNKDGTIIEVEANVKMLPDKRILAIARNITERKQAEEALTNNELRFRTLTGNAPVGIFQTDAAGKTTYVNETWLGFTGMTFDEAMGDGWIEAVHPDDRLRLSKEWYAKAELGLESSSEYRLIDKKGNTRWVAGKAVPLFNKTGEITGHMGTLSDVTERRKAEEAIRESEERYRALVENATEALVVMDVEKNKFISVSESAVKLFKMSKEELLKGGPMEVSPEYQPDGKLSSELAMKNINAAVAGNKLSFEWTHLDKDANPIPCEVWLVRLPSENQILIRGSIIDITERKRAEEELEQSYKSIRELTDHLQNIREEERTHIAREIHDELGQRLTVLKMDVSWLNKKIGKTADEAVKQKMKELLDMLDGTVITVRRISSELRPSLLDDLGLVAAIEWQLSEFEKRSGIKTNFTESGEEVKLPDAVKTGLFRIFQESLTNVARHADAARVKVSLLHKDNRFILRIADDGKGFDKHKIADKRTLGLLGMQERTSMIGGTYNIISEPEKGTTVVVTIPLVTL